MRQRPLVFCVIVTLCAVGLATRALAQETTGTIIGSYDVNDFRLGDVYPKGCMMLHTLRNIIDNAVRYAHRRVHITATTTVDSVQVEIDDDGPGIPPADRQRVFDRFVRLDSSRERNTGTTGLGLAIAHEIALTHHGHIAIVDNPTGGARVVVTLPNASSGPPLTAHSVAGPESAQPPKRSPNQGDAPT